MKPPHIENPRVFARGGRRITAAFDVVMPDARADGTDIQRLAGDLDAFAAGYFAAINHRLAAGTWDADASAAPILDHTRRVLDLVAAERARQDARWGEQNHPSVPDAREAGDGAAIYACAILGVPDAAIARGEGTWAHIALEELAETIEAATLVAQGKADVSTLARELEQLAAVAVAWREALDRREAP